MFGQIYCLLMTRNCLIGQLSILSTSIGPILQEMSTYVRHASRSSLSHILLLPFWFFIFFNSCGTQHPAVTHISYPQKNALLHGQVPLTATVHFLTSLFSKSKVMVYIFCYFLNNFKPAVKHVLKPSINWR